ncbi:MAG: glutathione S-transferase family protein [Gammaproteobacteria bacterium]|nr:glutathione S-transferase family protein [Gammaproteobacteria bacterium]
MTDLILHNYPQSHFAEKIRRLLAYKRVAWHSVEQPFMMPKPELVPLTGGVRRIPVLQVGADIYCDTRLIARKLEAWYPTPVCIPPDQAGLIGIIESWAGSVLMFQALLPTFEALLPYLPPEFLVDRAGMSPGLSREAILAGAPQALAQVRLSLAQLDLRLAVSPFLLGDAFTLADASCFFPLWLFKNSPALFANIEAHPRVADWFARIEGFGPGEVTPMAAQEALAVARAASPATGAPRATVSVEGLELGQQVAIAADDYGVEESRGTLVVLDADEIAITRDDATLGALAVHFPRSGYRITRL